LRAAAMTRTLTKPGITKARRTVRARRFNLVVKLVNGAMITGIRLRSGYVVDDPPAPPALYNYFDVNLVDDEYYVAVCVGAAAGTTALVGASTAKAEAEPTTVAAPSTGRARTKQTAKI